MSWWNANSSVSHTNVDVCCSLSSADNSGVIIVVIIVSILLLAILGSVFYFLYKKAKLPCGRSGKQEMYVILFLLSSLSVDISTGGQGPSGAERRAGKKIRDKQCKKTNK